MRIHPLPTSLACTLVLACFAAAHAVAGGHMRCAQSVVSEGFTPYEVLERCGDPIYEFSRVDYRYPGYTVHVDEWTYELGRNKFRRLLRFEDGRLVDIEVRGKPKGSRLRTLSSRSRR